MVNTKNTQKKTTLNQKKSPVLAQNVPPPRLKCTKKNPKMYQKTPQGFFGTFRGGGGVGTFRGGGGVMVHFGGSLPPSGGTLPPSEGAFPQVGEPFPQVGFYVQLGGLYGTIRGRAYCPQQVAVLGPEI